MAVTYEWDLELFDKESEDVIDHNHSDKLVFYCEKELRDALSGWVDDKGQSTRLVLVRNETFIIKRGSNAGLESSSRAWAYVSDSKLPLTFDDNDEGVKVPARFHDEFMLMLDRVRETA